MSVFSNRAPRTPETSAAYLQAVEALVGSADPIDLLGSTPSLLSNSLMVSTPEEWREPEFPDKWSLADVVHHLADTELVWGWRLRRILTEDQPTLEGFDQDAWADRLGYPEADPRYSLDLFKALRRSNLRLVARATPEDLARSALHVERGELRLEALVRHWAGHDVLHLKQIERIRRAVAADPAG